MLCPMLLGLLPLLIIVASCFSWRASGFANSKILSESRSLHPTRIFSTTIPRQGEEKQSRQQLYECQGCSQTFNSRNNLFRHLRGQDEASFDCSLSMGVLEEELMMTTVIRYGYLGMESTLTNNENVADMIHQAFVDHMNIFLDEHEISGEMQTNFTVSTSPITYSTAAKMRRPSLRQDGEVVGATSEVMSFNYRLSNKPSVISKWKEYANSSQLLGRIQAWLDDADTEGNSKKSRTKIRLHQMDALVPRSSKFHAERSCSQSSYRFLLPIEWILPSGNGRADAISQVEEWWSRISPQSTSHHREHQPRASKGEAPDFVQQLKRSLKKAESETVPNRKVRRQAEKNNSTDSSALDSDDTPLKLAHGRFGQLWRKRRRCWSNFAHPKLTGMSSSPGHEAVWRTMDRAKIVGLIDLKNDNNEDNKDQEFESKTDSNGENGMHIILECGADGFVVGQIPRIITSLVAMTNGWLPPNFFEIATRPDVYIDRPIAPPVLEKRLYFQSARYHFHELTSDGDNFYETIRTGSQSEQNWEVELQKTLLRGVSPTDSKAEENWLRELRDVVSPDLKRQIETAEREMTSHSASDSAQKSSNALPLVDTDAPTGVYSATLELLRDVVNSSRWPATSDARSRVIKSSGSSSNVLATKKKSLASQFPGTAISAGSFTVVNEAIWESDDGLPLANALFSELTKSVFELEKEIIRQQNPLPAAEGMDRQSSSSVLRSPSTHCAVNRNAQFTPHVDSGRGQGQSVSMIVGLGNYTGGDIFVDGNTPYDIRYEPLEFDGWKQLHWTAPFIGERYSLVWFTPEMSERNSAVPQQRRKLLNADDELAQRLAEEHSKAVPFLPPLKFRNHSTDALVIKELLDSETGSAYTMNPNTNMKGFSLENHQCVLDVGAHIGVFSRYALAAGCQHIIAYEPEPSNFDLLSQNLDITSQPAMTTQPTIEVHSSAVAHESSKSRTLVQARSENSGKQNTWRHSLEEYSQYVDRSTKLPNHLQKNTLDRFVVDCISFFRDSKQKGALVPGVSFVKLDCEGAEIDILLSSSASQRSAWLDATHLVVEWSFTKERRVSIFHRAMSNLREAGFEVYYEGIGSWWDTDAGIMWPYPNDLVVFAIMNKY